ncbi:hypothetical protein [Vitreimonas sp.]|uniref:ORC-CDC6 family AAA ATPase n=1 Tax=Vitreimonas sp. TaxID=3069702 RepID=UPI002EDB027C
MSAIFSHPFENDNAKYLDPAQVAATFVPIRSYWRLLAEKNHVLMGTRGSGKTAVARMVSHDHLRRLDDDAAREIVRDKRFIGVFAPAGLNWISGLKSQLLVQQGNERDYFITRFNFIVAQALLGTIQSCIEAYTEGGKRAAQEYEIVRRLLRLWAPEVPPPEPIYSLQDLKRSIADADFRLQRVHTRSIYRTNSVTSEAFDAALGQTFSTGLLEPAYAARRLADEMFEFGPSTKWILAIDEMEFLSAEHHRILNSLLRVDTPGFVFKFVTAPYCHYTLETETTQPLIEGHDFEYVYMDHERILDQDFVSQLEGWERRYSFAFALFTKRARAAGIDMPHDALARALGSSEVLDPLKVTSASIHEITRRFYRHANDKTMLRIEKLLSAYETSPRTGKRLLLRRMSDELVRKMKPAVVLRERVRAVGARKGTAYSGLSMVLACTDMNPRILIRTFNMLFPDLAVLVGDGAAISEPAQNEVMETIGVRFYDSIGAVRDVGPDLKSFIGLIGRYFSERLHAEPIGTDVFSSIALRAEDVEFSGLVHQAVAWGFMYPHFKDEKRSALPADEGEFRLAYTLAPYFKLLPRRGRPVSLNVVFPQRRLPLT